MTLGTTDAAPGLAKPIVSDSDRLFPEVVKLVASMRGGAAGLVKQFEDKGLAHVALSMTSRDGTRMISSQQVSHGLGTAQIEWLATASGLDARVVRKELVLVLPMVLEQLSAGAKG